MKSDPATDLDRENDPASTGTGPDSLTAEETRFAEVLGRLLAERWRARSADVPPPVDHSARKTDG